MLKPRCSRTAGLLLLTLASLPAASHAAGPTLLKRTVAIKLQRYLRYWPNPKAKEPQYNTYSWVPKVSFELLGPVPAGSQFVAEFSKPNGAAWISTKIPTSEVGDDVAETFKTDTDDSWEKKAITGIGTFPFKIWLKNALTGKNQLFFSGCYEVDKYNLPRVPANDKNKTDFRTVEDWRVPIGYLWLNPADSNENVPPVSTQMWFRGASSGTDMQAILFLDGKQLDTARGFSPDEIAVPSSETAFNWSVWQFNFYKVRGFNKDESNNSWSGTTFLDKNPGSYEIRVLRAGKLARVARFTVGEDGKIADNGIARNNKLGGIRMVLPVSVSGTLDGPLKPAAWKNAFYGNPLAGFTAPSGAAALKPVTGAAPRVITADNGAAQAPLVGGPTLLKSTLVIRADRMNRYMKAPNAENFWSWVPEGYFSVLGPIPAGTKFIIDFYKPSGALWTSMDVVAPTAAENEWRSIGFGGSSTHFDNRSIIETGKFSFKIRVANEATGTKGQLFAGNFTVGKFHVGNALPAFKNQFEYYVDYDWQLPIGYVWVDWLRDPGFPALHFNTWIKNSTGDNTKVAAYVIYKGEPVGSSTGSAGSAGTTTTILTSGSEDPAYKLWDFTFGQVRGWNTGGTTPSEGTHIMAANPGTYELKVTFQGDVIRVAKFTVGADGKIVDNGLAAKNKIGGIAMLVPVDVKGKADGKYNAQAWKTGFFGNPIQGFTAP